MTKPGIDADGVAKTEADHFGRCPSCGAVLACATSPLVLAHVHGAEIEIGQGETPPARPEKSQ